VKKFGTSHAYGESCCGGKAAGGAAALLVLQSGQQGIPWASSLRCSSAGYCARASRSGSDDFRSAMTVSPPDRALAHGDQGSTPRWQVKVDARPKADQAYPLSNADALAFVERR